MTINATGFDRDYYLSRNPDVAAAGIDPYFHYQQFGWREGRNPNELFDVHYYLTKNTDVAAAGIDPLQHYISAGAKEGRNPNAFFDTQYYLSHNNDVASAGINPLVHFIASGWREGRNPSASFDVQKYLAHNSDVAAAGIDPLQQYIETGARQGRAHFTVSTGTLADGFDREYYLSHNPDVAAAGVDPYQHYLAYGRGEGRAPNGLFDATYYLDHNPDVRAAGIDPFQHYMQFGWSEGRRPSAAFDTATYKAVFGLTNTNPLTDYLLGQRTSGIPADASGNPILAGGGSLTLLHPTLVGSVQLALNTGSVHFSAPDSPLDQRTTTGYTTYDFSNSIGDFSVAGSGVLPSTLTFGYGHYSLSGSYDQGGQISTLQSNAGHLDMTATINNGGLLLQTGSGGATVSLQGNAGLVYSGGSGRDEIHAGSNNDSIAGGLGSNLIDGGLGNDLARWDLTPSLVTDADLVRGTAFDRTGNGAFADQLISIENLQGGEGNDRLAGDGGANLLSGGGGNDLLVGRDGADVLLGGDGNDVMLGGDGADRLSGGLGNDLLVDTARNVTVNGTTSVMGGDGGDDTLVLRFGSVSHPAGEQQIAMDGGVGADSLIFDPDGGTWADAIVRLNHSEGDRLDLSHLRDLSGGQLTFAYVSAAASVQGQNLTIDLSHFHSDAGALLSGQIVFDNLNSTSQLAASDLILSNGLDWKALIPASDLAFA